MSRSNVRLIVVSRSNVRLIVVSRSNVRLIVVSRSNVRLIVVSRSNVRHFKKLYVEKQIILNPFLAFSSALHL